MSVSYNISNLSTKKDLEEKRDEFFKTLRLKARLNRNYEQAMLTRKQLDKLGVKPVGEAPRSLEEESRDDIFQQQLAEKYLREIMKPEDARKVLGDLIATRQVYELNSNWKGIKFALKGRTNISAAFFKQFFKRYLTTLEATGGVYTPIPLPEDLIARLPGDLRDAWEGWSKGEVDPRTGERVAEKSLLKRTADILGQSEANIRTAVESEKDIAGQDKTETFKPTARRLKLVPSEKAVEEGFLSAKPKQTAEMGTQTAVDPAKFLTTTDGNIGAFVLAQGDVSPIYNYARSQNLMGKLTRTKIQRLLSILGESTIGSKAEVLSRLESKLMEEETGSGLFMTTPQRPTSNYGPMEVVTGRGTRPMLHMNGRKVKCGRGMYEERHEVKLLPIGKYWLYVPSLFDESLVMIRTPNKSTYIQTRKMMISELFKRVLLETIESGSLNRSDFNRLSDDEQKYLYYIAQKTKVEHKVGFPANFEANDSADIDRFNLVRGEILAGNNDPSLIREMRHLIVKLVAEDKIRKRTVSDLLYELAILAN